MTGKLKVGDAAPSIQVMDAEGNAIALSAIWSDKPVVVTFLRHFGWPMCQAMLDQLAQNTAWFNERGVRVAAVTMGKPYETKMFCAQRSPDVVCLSNPDQSAYKAYDIGKMNAQDVINPGSWSAWVKVMRQGYKPASTGGQDGLQLGATFIIGTDGKIALAHYNKYMGDHPEMKKLQSVAEELGKRNVVRKA